MAEDPKTQKIPERKPTTSPGGWAAGTEAE